MGGAESPAPSGSRGARPAWDYRLTFAVEAGRVVVVESRQLPSEHDPNLSFWSPVLQPGEEDEQRPETQEPATRREGGQVPARSEMTAASTNRGLGKAAAGECPPIVTSAGEAEPRRGTSTLK